VRCNLIRIEHYVLVGMRKQQILGEQICVTVINTFQIQISDGY